MPKLTDIPLKPVTHLGILYADRRKSPGVPVAAMAIFADLRDRRIHVNRRYLACRQVSAIKFAGIRQVCPFPRFFTLIAANRH